MPRSTAVSSQEIEPSALGHTLSRRQPYPSARNKALHLQTVPFPHPAQQFLTGKHRAYNWWPLPFPTPLPCCNNRPPTSETRLEHGNKIFISKFPVAAICLNMMFILRRPLYIHIPGIPFTVKCRNTVNPPVNKYPKFGIPVPFRRFIGWQRLPFRLKLFRLFLDFFFVHFFSPDYHFLPFCPDTLPDFS